MKSKVKIWLSENAQHSEMQKKGQIVLEPREQDNYDEVNNSELKKDLKYAKVEEAIIVGLVKQQLLSVPKSGRTRNIAASVQNGSCVWPKRAKEEKV